MSDHFQPSTNPAIGWTDEHGTYHHAPGHEPGQLDSISHSRLEDTLTWAREAAQEATDLAFDAPVNHGLESLEAYAHDVAQALEDLISAARTIQRETRTTGADRD